MAKKVKKRRSTPPKTWFVWLMLLLFFPIGLYLLWKHKLYALIPRVTITILVSFLLFTAIFTAILYKHSLDKKAEEANAEPTTEQQADPLEIAAEHYNPQQLAFLQFSQDLNQEIKIYTSIQDEYKLLISGIKKNKTPAPGIAAAYIDTFNRRLEQSKERILAMQPPATLNDSDKQLLSSNLQSYAIFLTDLEASFMLMQDSLVRSDVEASKLSDQNLEKAKNNLELIKTDLTTVATALNVPYDVRLEFKNLAKIPPINETVQLNKDPIQKPTITENEKTTATIQSLPQGIVEGAPIEIKGDIITIGD
ncbi:MAG: hypothetical protein K0Q53_828 [Massilibacillus sp.]|jgi:hypothetical protein|nr:hypothetical protein [Massilibacillus sp.]